jgi:DNA polymerase I-like protein with 3'-5' exonuclease and polymerase domains
MTHLITVDFETYYDQDYSLSKISTEEYVRAGLFQTIGFSYKIDDAPPKWVSGSELLLAAALDQLPWADSLVLAHNTMFDGAILSWRYGVKPMGWLDTQSMARALHGVEQSVSLKNIAVKYGVGQKGTEVDNAKGKRLVQFSQLELAHYGEYCKNDVQLTYDIFNIMMQKGKFPKSELKLIDLTLQMFIDPVLRLDGTLLEQHLAETVGQKTNHLVSALQAIGHKDLAVKHILGDEEVKAEVRKTLMSNPKFAQMLEGLGISPPKKISMTTGKETYAFAKTDAGLQDLLEHEDPRVQALVAARLGTKSTIEETRTQRFIDIGKRGLFPIPLKYYAAHTGRWGGTDSINLQNLPSRGDNAGKLKNAILAPEGYVFIDADSSQIEARTLAWESEQDDLVGAFAKGEDVYKIMASAIYNKSADTIDKVERFVGKTTILGAGYGMGGPKFQLQLKTFGTEIDSDEAKRIIDTYRATYPKIPQLWREAQEALRCMARGQTMTLGRNALLTVDAGPTGGRIRLPNGLYVFYSGLAEVVDGEGKRQFQYTTRKGTNKIYGGKVVENFTQAIARCIIGEQMLRIAKRYKVVLTVHDAIGIVARQEEADEARAYVESCMRWTPSWAEGLPVNCESGMGMSYGDC